MFDTNFIYNYANKIIQAFMNLIYLLEPDYNF